MKNILFAALLLSGCAEAPVDEVLGSYLFQGYASEFSTCSPSIKESKFIFEIVSESEMELNLEDQTLSGRISRDSFDVTGDSPYKNEQTLKFTSDDIQSGTATIASIVNANPLCFAKFDGVFDKID